MIKGRKLTALEIAIEDAARFHTSMVAYLTPLAARTEASGDFTEYDEAATELREQAEEFLARIIAEYNRERN